MNVVLNVAGSLSRTLTGKEELSSGVLVFGKNGMGLVRYEWELDGKTEYFRELASLSRARGGVVVSACDTDTYGSIRRSAVVADKGKLLGVSDEVHVAAESEYAGGAGYTTYKTSAGKIGVLVGRDAFFHDAMATLSLSDADFILWLFCEPFARITEPVLRAQAFLYGTPVVCVGEKCYAAASPKGEILFTGREKTFTFPLRAERAYAEVKEKIRGHKKT